MNSTIRRRDPDDDETRAGARDHANRRATRRDSQARRADGGRDPMSNGEVIVRPTPLWSDNPAARDLLGFADIAAPALEALARERLDPVTVGVVGWWGSGKSTILGLIERALR